MKKNIFICLAAMLALPLFSQERKHAFEVNERLGRGINLGNTFEAPSEEAWGNPWNPEYFKMIAGLGFTHVRVPVRWEPADRSMNTAPYTIYPEFMERIKSVVDEALKNKLHIIINMHHHEALIAGQAGQRERFLSQWNQISTYFKDYPDSLLFELLNEPNDQVTAELWNGLASDALSEIRKTNAGRIVLTGTAEWGGIDGLSRLQLPDDEHIILTVHYYNPFNFTHQGAEFAGMQSVTGIKWNDTEPDRETIQQEFKAVIRFSETNKIPVHIGEFGTYHKADMDSRVRWTTYLSRWFEEQGFSWAYWEFSSGFGIYDPITKTFVRPLVDALLYNPIPEPVPAIITPVYKSNFQNGADGWMLINQSGASSTLLVKDNKLELTITAGGSEGWHIQLIKAGLLLEKGQMYRISFTTSASTVCYMGRNADPWTPYSQYYPLISAGQEEQSSWYVFTMNDETDPVARCVFDLGQAIGMVNVIGTATFSNIQIDKLDFNTTGVTIIKQEKDLPLYLTQDQNQLYFLNEDDYIRISIFSPDGSLLAKHPLTAGFNEINTGRWASGIYIVAVDGKGKNAVRKIWKK
jgi:aryl-phospho-beta-D-glucosidase BglC (GH1 family)